jgi:AcrR family transcriptional regulator
VTAHRPLRADAARNRQSLLAAAADEFAERGLDASVADIARRAGVGKGTVFRHFATKDDLLAAIVTDRIDALEAVGRRLLTAEDPGAALLEFLTAAAHQRQQRDLSFLQEAGDTNPRVAEARHRMFDLVHRLVDRAREHGAVRADITGADVMLLMCAPNYVVSYVPDAPPDLWQRYVAIIFDGLRPAAAHPLPHPPPALGETSGSSERTA